MPNKELRKMEEYECIRVPFRLWPEDEMASNRDGNTLLAFLQSMGNKPWLTYLADNAITVKSFKDYIPESHMYDVSFHFYLDPKKATVYRIKYAQ
jgi:hypothetical protein